MSPSRVKRLAGWPAGIPSMPPSPGHTGHRFLRPWSQRAKSHWKTNTKHTLPFPPHGSNQCETFQNSLATAFVWEQDVELDDGSVSPPTAGKALLGHRHVPLAASSLVSPTARVMVMTPAGHHDSEGIWFLTKYCLHYCE